MRGAFSKTAARKGRCRFWRLYQRGTSPISDETQHPFADRTPVVGFMQAIHRYAIDRLADMLLADIEQGTRVLGHEFRVALEAQHLITNAVCGMRTERAGRQ